MPVLPLLPCCSLSSRLLRLHSFCTDTVPADCQCMSSLSLRSGPCLRPLLRLPSKCSPGFCPGLSLSCFRLAQGRMHISALLRCFHSLHVHGCPLYQLRLHLPCRMRPSLLPVYFQFRLCLSCIYMMFRLLSFDPRSSLLPSALSLRPRFLPGALPCRYILQALFLRCPGLSLSCPVRGLPLLQGSCSRLLPGMM